MQRQVIRRLGNRSAFPLVAAVARSSQIRGAVRGDSGSRARVIPSFMCSLRAYSGGHHEEPSSRSGQYLLDKSDVLTRVLEVVKNFEKVDASKVTPESHFVKDLGLNSLDVVEVVFAIEQEFILDIPDHDAEKIQSIPDAVEYIAQNPMAK
ncbi:putative acyl carrier protein [Leishmania major strain Friedlin]|uniref:Acyl carrier protein n=1 Tax=Leishmania major TaxID=5664 RepID=E9AD06_LEIMA|nr:putative acyl carrier protein [Leishmania major strain Friedlin]7AM2_CC Chain CC, Acyl carrier protein [Leishmania tarentolae]CAG9576629.1 Acyl_carrier_protein_-_mitochondrial_-_putative [Leishmania major strain Friedlin]CBZ12089.1 putative acyl carrier protein [Leishmania major strain Friedlin]|eukprot:XP_003721835.1 putative acyl carrier protein [Leishmania major strain Friedlin]